MGGGPPEFPQDFPCPVVLGNRIKEVRYLFTYRAITFYGSPFQTLSVEIRFGNFPRGPHFPPILSHDPIRTTRAGFNVRMVWAVSFSLAATKEIAIAFYS